MLKNKEPALLVKAKLERLREKLQDFIEHDDFEASRYVYVGSGLDEDGDEVDVTAYDLIDDISAEIDYKIAEITKKHLL